MLQTERLPGAVFIEEIEQLRENLQIGERIRIGMPIGKHTEGHNTMVVAHYPHHAVFRTDSGFLESFRWLDLLTVYRWKYLI